MTLDLPTTLFKAIRRPDGRIVCIDTDYLTRTTKVVKDERDYLLAKSLGWCDHPKDALDRMEREEDALSDAAALRHADDARMSPAALAEAAAVDATTIRHLPEIPIAPKRGRGRPRKIVPSA